MPRTRLLTTSMIANKLIDNIQNDPKIRRTRRGNSGHRERGSRGEHRDCRRRRGPISGKPSILVSSSKPPGNGLSLFGPDGPQPAPVVPASQSRQPRTTGRRPKLRQVLLRPRAMLPSFQLPMSGNPAPQVEGQQLAQLQRRPQSPAGRFRPSVRLVGPGLPGLGGAPGVQSPVGGLPGTSPTPPSLGSSPGAPPRRVGSVCHRVRCRAHRRVRRRHRACRAPRTRPLRRPVRRRPQSSSAR